MSLGLEEIRDRSERLKGEVARERYETKAGLKDRPDFTSVYAEAAFLTGPDVLPAIQRALSEAEDEARRRLRALESWIGEQRVEAAIAPLEDEFRGWESTTTVRLDGEEIPFRRLLRRIENETEREARLALEARRAEKLEEAIPLQVDMLHREREALSELGLGGLVETRERLTGVNLRGLEREAFRVLAATEDVYRDHLGRLARRRFGTHPEALDRSDLRWLRRMAWHDEHFRLAPLLEAARRDLAALGLPLEAGGRVRLDLESRPAKVTRSFCAALEVPHRIVLVVARSGGRADCVSTLHQIGHALHFAYTDPDLPFEYRALGDVSVTEGFAVLIEALALDPRWLRHAIGFPGGALEEHRIEAGVLQLYELRRLAAKLLFEVELYDAELPGELGGRYAEVVGGVTGVRYDPRTFLDDLDRGFWVARQLRGWMLAAILAGALRDRFDEEWYRDPDAGPFLGELMAGGQRDDAGRLASRLGAERLDAEPLLTRTAEWLP